MNGQGDYAYGRRSRGGGPTDHQFTGQKQDGTGLMYYGARYYDPQIGMFISPDTLVPDPTHVFDYNRYMYARGNPLKYTDPTGHCATTEPSTSDQSAHGEWAECWQYANTIWAQWDKTDYWNQMWPESKERDSVSRHGRETLSRCRGLFITGDA